MKRVINFVKGRRDDRRDHKYVNSPICVEITNPAGQKIQSEDEHIIGLQSGYGYQIDINGKDKNMTKLHKAAWQGNLDKVKIHLKKADVNSVDHSNRTALHFAVAQGHSNVASFLLGAKALFDLRDSDGMTPFLKAVECGNKECVNMLLEQGADVNVVDRNGNTGLHLSSKLGFLNISSMLLIKGANINISNNMGEFALHLATEGEHRELVALLLCSGGQVNVVDRDNRTPLMLAARFGHASLVSLLLEHGASLEACDSNGWTAEDYALIGGHQQLALDLKAPTREQLCKEMEEAVVNENSSDETKEEQTTDDCGKDICSDESEANQPAIVHETAIVQINSQLIESNNGNNDFHDRTIQEEEDGDDVGMGNEGKEDKKEEAETVESPRSCITPPPLQPPRSWDLIQAGMIDEKEVQRRSLTTLGTLRSRRESFNENSNNNNNNGGSSPNQVNDDLEKITDIVKSVEMEGLVDDESSEGEENLPLDRAVSVRRGKVAPLERTPSLDLTLTEEELTKSKENQGCPAGSLGGTLGREDTLQGYEEIWEKNANISEVVDNAESENNNKLPPQSSVADGDSNEVFDTGQLTTDISEQLVQRNREINTAVGYVTNEIYRIMVEKNEYQADGVDGVINQTVHTSSSLDNLDERKPRFIEMESSRSCDNLDNRFMTLEEKLCSGIYSAETLDTEPSINENEATQSLDNLDESPVGTVIKRNMHREVQSLDTLDDYDQCCSRGCVEARPIKKHCRNKSVSVGQHGWSKSVDVLTKPSNIDRIQIDTKKIDAQLECYDEALRELAQAELVKRNASSGEESSASSRRNDVKDNKPCFPPPPPVLTGDIPYFSEIVSSQCSSQKSREYFMKPKDESDFSVNQDYSPLPKIQDKSGSVDGLLDSDRMSTVENTSVNGSFKSDSRFSQSNTESDSLFNHELPPPPPPIASNEMFETDLYLNLETLPGDLENENFVINGKVNGVKHDDAVDTDDSESKRAREVENNLYKLEKDLFNINMSTILKPRATDVNQNGIVHQDIVVANGEVPVFGMRSKGGEKGMKQTSFAGFEGLRSRVGRREDSLSPLDRSAGEDSPKVPPRYKRSLRKGKSESEVWKLSDGKTSKGRSKSASMYSEVEALFEKPVKGRKKSGGSGEIQEKSESDSELCERPLRRKRKMLLAMRGVVAGSKDSEDDDDTSIGDPPFWLSTDKGGHFARQDTCVLATQPTRIPEKSQHPSCAGASQSGDKPPDLDKDWTSSDADTASGSDEVAIGNAFSLGSHHKLLKEHLRQATNEKTALEEAVAWLREREERLQYELADARQALSARDDTVRILQEQARRIETRHATLLDEVQTLRHSVSTTHLELKHLRQLCDKLAMEKAEALDEVNRLRDNSSAEQSYVGPEKEITSEAKPEQMQLLQRQKLEAERRSEVLVNHLEETMRQCESAKTEKDALARQNIADIKKLQQDTLLWKERYEDCLGRLERIEGECQPRLLEAQRTIDVLRSSIRHLEAEKELNQDNRKAKVMDEVISRIKRAQNKNKLVPKSSHDKISACLGNCMKKQRDGKGSCGRRYNNSMFDQNDSRSYNRMGFSDPRTNKIPAKVHNCVLNCCDKFRCIYEAQRKVISNDRDKDYLSKLSLFLDHNRKLLENLLTARKEKDCIRNELYKIRKNMECDLQKSTHVNEDSPNEQLVKLNGDKKIINGSCNQPDVIKFERKYHRLSKVKSILSREEFEIEGILHSIQEVGKDLESIMNNLCTQIVLVESFNQSDSEPENHFNEVTSQNYAHCSDEATHPDNRNESRILVKEIVDIRRDLSHLHGESERLCKLFKIIFKEKRNEDALSDELKSTADCVQSCSNEIEKLNFKVIRLHKIVRTLMTEFKKNSCQCSIDSPRYQADNINNKNGRNVVDKEEYNSYQNKSKNLSKQTDPLFNVVYELKYLRTKDEKVQIGSRQKDLESGEDSFSNRGITEDGNYSIEIEQQSSNRKDEFAKRQKQIMDDNPEEYTSKKPLGFENSANEENIKYGVAIKGKNSSHLTITVDHSYKFNASNLKNSQRFLEIRQKYGYYSTGNSYASEANGNNFESLPESGSKILDNVVGNENDPREQFALDVEGVRKVLDYEENSVICLKSDNSLIVETSLSVHSEGVRLQQVEEDSNPGNKASEIGSSMQPVEAVPQLSSQEIIYLKKALSVKSTKLSNQSEMSQDCLEKLATNSVNDVDVDMTNSSYESVTDRDTDLLDRLSSCQTVTGDPGYMSEPAYTSISRGNEYHDSYPSSVDLDYANYPKNETTVSAPGSLKPFEKKTESIDEQKLENCSSRDKIIEITTEITDEDSNKINCKSREKNEQLVSMPGDSSQAPDSVIDNLPKYGSTQKLENSSSRDKIIEITEEDSNQINCKSREKNEQLVSMPGDSSQAPDTVIDNLPKYSSTQKLENSSSRDKIIEITEEDSNQINCKSREKNEQLVSMPGDSSQAPDTVIDNLPKYGSTQKLENCSSRDKIIDITTENTEEDSNQINCVSEEKKEQLVSRPGDSSKAPDTVVDNLQKCSTGLKPSQPTLERCVNNFLEATFLPRDDLIKTGGNINSIPVPEPKITSIDQADVEVKELSIENHSKSLDSVSKDGDEKNEIECGETQLVPNDLDRFDDVEKSPISTFPASTSKFSNSDQNMSNDQLDKTDISDSSSSSKLNNVDDTLRQSEEYPESELSLQVDSEKNGNNFDVSNNYNREQSSVSVVVEKEEVINNLQEGGTPSVSETLESYKSSIQKSQIGIREPDTPIKNSTSYLSEENHKLGLTESKCPDVDENVPDDQLKDVKTPESSSSKDLNALQQSRSGSEGGVLPDIVSSRENECSKCALNNSNVERSNVSVGVQTKEESLSDLKKAVNQSVSETLLSTEGANEKSRENFEESISNTILNGTSNQSLTENNGKSGPKNIDLGQTDSFCQVEEEAKATAISSSGDLSSVTSVQQSKTESEQVIISLESKNNSDVSNNSNYQKSNSSVTVQTEENINDMKKTSPLEISQSSKDAVQKSWTDIRTNNTETENLINNDDSDPSSSERNFESKCSEMVQTDPYDSSNSGEMEKVDGEIQHSEIKTRTLASSKLSSQENVIHKSDSLKNLNVSVGIQTKESVSDLEQVEAPSASGTLQSSEGANEKSQIIKRKIIRNDNLVNSSTSVRSSSETIEIQSSLSNSEQHGLSVRICNCNDICECLPKQNPNDKSKKSCLKYLPYCLKKRTSSGSKNNDQQINFLLEDLNLNPSIFSGKPYSKLLPIEQSLGLFFKNNLSDSYSLDDFKSNLKLSDWRLNPFLERRIAKELFDISLVDGSSSSENPLDEENELSHLQFYADLKRPILLPRINLSSVTCKADNSKDVITNIGQKLSAAQSTLDYTLQATASASNIIDQEDDAICLDFQQVENVECPDSVDTTKIGIVNDINRTSNGFQECELAAVPKAASLSRERQEMAVGRIRQQALIESENNLSAKIAEINSVLHQQLVEQDRRRAHNEMQMKKEFELTRQKLLMELSKVQTALKAKEAEERVLREKYDKLSRDVEKTAEVKRKQLIEKSYSLNLAHPATMWEKELSIKRNVVQTPLAPPPPPPPLPPPDIPSSFSTDDRFSHLSLRAQLHQSITKHRSNPRNLPDQTNLAAISNSQLEEVSSGSSSGTSVVASTSSNKKR